MPRRDFESLILLLLGSRSNVISRRFSFCTILYETCDEDESHLISLLFIRQSFYTEHDSDENTLDEQQHVYRIVYI